MYGRSTTLRTGESELTISIIILIKKMEGSNRILLILEIRIEVLHEKDVRYGGEMHLRGCEFTFNYKI